MYADTLRSFARELVMPGDFDHHHHLPRQLIA